MKNAIRRKRPTRSRIRMLPRLGRRRQTPGIMDGTKPQSPLTREQLAVILQRLGLLGKGVK